MTRTKFMIGTTPYLIQFLESLTTPVVPPKSTFSPYSGLAELGSGNFKGIGYPVATWQWQVLQQDQRDELRTFCPDVSSTVYIRTYTKENSDETNLYEAIMTWPVLEEEVDARRRISFVLKFTHLILQSDDYWIYY